MSTAKILTIVAALIVVAGAVYYFSLPQAQPQPVVNTYGMLEYTDAAHGFTFWYPSTWQVSATAASSTSEFPGATLVEQIEVGEQGGITLYVATSPASTITDEPNGHASPIAQTKYFYDSSTRAWMVTYPEGRNGAGSGATTTADISNTTMAGLPMLQSGRRFDTSIIPLNTTTFVVVSDGGGESASALAKTLAPLNASIDPAVQAATLQAEESAYTAPSATTTQQQTTATTAIEKSVTVNGVTITPQALLEDSRCPVNVLCIQAGTVRLRAGVQGVASAYTFTLGQPQTIGDMVVTLSSVVPAQKHAGVAIALGDYRFTFTVVSAVSSPVQSSTGVRGTVSLGPTCPVQRVPPDPACADKPYATTISVYRAGHSGVYATTKSIADGTYTIALPAGQYTLSAKGGQTLPRCAPVNVTVPSSGYAISNISCDTGIR